MFFEQWSRGKSLCRGYWPQWRLSFVEGLKDFVRSSRVENKVFIAQHCSNKHGCFMALAEYNGCG